MRTSLILAVIATSLMCVPAHAQERVGSAAIGVVSGFLILGPVGAVAGGLVGYTAGPEMRRGLTGEQPPRARQKVRRSSQSATSQGTTGQSSKRAVAASPPPAQSVARAPDAAPAAAKAAPSIKATQPLPPVQSLD